MIGKNMANSYSSVEVAVLYFAVVIISTWCDWKRHVKTMGSHFNAAVWQCSTFSIL
jgi:hypothetical protein